MVIESCGNHYLLQLLKCQCPNNTILGFTEQFIYKTILNALQCNPYIVDTVGTGFIVHYSEVSSLEGWKITVT